MYRDLKRTTALAVLLVSLCAERGWGAPATVVAPPQAVEKKAADEKPDAKKDEKPAKAPANDEKQAAKAAAVKAAANAKVQNDAAMAQQWLPQFRPILVTELLFIRQMCDLASEQRPKIKAAGEASLLDAAAKFAQFQQAGRVAGARGSQPDPHTIIREGLMQALKEVLTPEQLAQLQKEGAARAAQHKRATILSVVSRLDAILCLTADQREKITEELSSHWQDAWEKWLMIHRYGDQYFPQVPDQFVVVHLNDDQRSAWRTLQKIDVNYFGGQVGQQPDDEWWNNEPAKPAPAAIRVFERWLKGIAN